MEPSALMAWYAVSYIPAHMLRHTAVSHAWPLQHSMQSMQLLCLECDLWGAKCCTSGMCSGKSSQHVHLGSQERQQEKSHALVALLKYHT